MKRHRRISLVLIGSASIACATTPAPAFAPVPVFYCGGTTNVAVVERYFADLRQALATSAPRRRFNDFVNRSFGTTSARGRTLYFHLADVGLVTPGRITLQEWREIARRGSQGLRGAGWRGCFMDHGKVTFEGSATGFHLIHFSRNRPWVEP